MKTSVCRNMAPPKQLKPSVWKRTRIPRLRFGDSVIVVEYVRTSFKNIVYEDKNKIKDKD